LKENYIRLVR